MTKLSVVFKITLPSDEGEEYKYLEADNFIIGRSPDVEVCLKDKGVSRNHLKVSAHGKKILIRDLGSAYGTRVNGTVIPKDEDVQYKPGAPIKLGGWEEPVRLELFHLPMTEQEEGGLIIQEARMEADNIRRKVEHEGQKVKVNAENNAARTVDEARSKAARIIEEAKQQNALMEKQIEAAAREKAERLEEQAQEEAQAILEKARQEVEPLKQKILKDAEDKGQETAKVLVDAAEQKARVLAESAAQKIESLIGEYQEKGRAYVKEKERVGAEVIKAAEAKAAQLLSDSQMSVNEILRKAQDDGEQDRRRIELEAQEKQEEVLEKAQKEVERLIEDGKSQAAKMVEAAKEESRKIIETTHELNQAAVARLQVLKEQITNVEEDKKSVLKQSEALQEEKRQYDLEIEEVRAKKEKLKDEVAQAKLNTQKQLNQIEAEVRKVEAALRKKEIACDEAERNRATHEEAAQEAIKLKEDVQNTLDEMEKTVTLQKEKLGREIEELKAQRDEVAETLDVVRQTYEQKQEKISEELNAYREKRMQKLESELSKLRLKAEEDIKSAKDANDQEIAQAKKELEIEVNEIRSSEMARLETVKAREEAALYERKNHHIEEITRNLDMVFRSRAGKLEKMINNGDAFYKEIGEVVRKVVNQEYDVHQEQVKTIMTFNPDDVKKVKKFWQKTVGFSVLGIALIALHFQFPEWPTVLMQKIRPDKSASEVIKEEMKQEQLKNAFNPNLTPNFKETYTENVLYTENYLGNERSSSYHDLWIKELNKFVLDDLNLSEEATVNLVAAESVLLKNLEEQRAKITNKQLKEGIKKLEDIESDAVVKMSQLLGGENNYEKYYKFKNDFYEKFTAKMPASNPVSQ